jgi:predicted DNA-binding protein (MmcQ/YjbR family)
MSSPIDWIREFCLSLPHSTEDVQWENNLLFRIAKKIYCIVPLEPQTTVKICFKCTPESFAELVEMDGVIPAPYLARNHWVALVDWGALRQTEIKESVRDSYRLVFEKLPKRLQISLSEPESSEMQSPRKRPGLGKPRRTGVAVKKSGKK